jgi:hypothetical protein
MEDRPTSWPWWRCCVHGGRASLAHSLLLVRSILDTCLDYYIAHPIEVRGEPERLHRTRLNYVVPRVADRSMTTIYLYNMELSVLMSIRIPVLGMTS